MTASACYPKLPTREYLKLKGWNASLLKLALDRTPAHAWEAYLKPDRPPSKETPALRIGTLLHKAVLEPDRWAKVIPCDAGPKTKAFAAAVEEAQKEGKKVAAQDEYDLALSMANAVRAHPVLGPRFPQQPTQLNEITLSWTSSSGHPCRARLDAVRWTGQTIWIADLKTSVDAGCAEFGKSALNYNYILQGAFYTDAVFACRAELEPMLGLEPGTLEDAAAQFEFIVIEKESPHLIARYQMTADQVALGRRMYERALEVVESASSIDYWAGYDVSPKPLELPYWAERQIERLLGESQ